MTETPTIYSPGPACPGCAFTERTFLGRGITPDVVDIESAAGQAALSRLPKNSPRQAPIVTYRGMVWSGVRPDLIDEVEADVRQRERERDAATKAYATPRAAA